VTHGICNLAIVPVRKEPAHASELVTQLLFGEHFEIIGNSGNFSRIRTAYDLYDGWVATSQFEPIDHEEYLRLNKEQYCVSFDLVQIMMVDSQMFSVVLGSSLPHFKDHTCRLGTLAFRFEGTVKCPEKLQTSKGIIENAYMYLHAPYLWGGRSPFGIDCSGFTQMVFKLAGIRLKRDAWQQAEQGSLINLIDEARAGDLAFFDNEEGRIVHVGIVLPGQKIIHASGKVRVDALDHHGIYNTETRRYSHNLRLIKRFI
jgi:hypothetical protein